MKRFFKFLLLILLAGPFLVCDPQTGIDYYQLTGLPVTMSGTDSIPKDTTGTYGFKYDISALPAGTYTVKAKACIAGSDSVAARCSVDSVPFTFTVPTPSAPVGLKLVK